jgi:hypothetical protein
VLSKRERYVSRLKELRNERSSWEPAWRDITEHTVPYRTRWHAHERNRGDKRDHKLLNSRATRAVRGLAAFLMAGITSPARDWFGLTTTDTKRAEVEAVKTYLEAVKRVLTTTFQSSGLYRALSNGTYIDLATIGTHAMFLEESAKLPGRVSFRPMAIGEYYLDVDDSGRTDTCFREIPYTIRQMVQKFGLKAVSDSVKNAWDRGNYGHVRTVIHAIQPNEEREPGTMGYRGMRFSSCWYEEADDRQNGMLRESGYEEFPVIAPRWTALEDNAYGWGPGWDARGDCRMLQHHEKARLELVDMLKKPPMFASGDIKRASLVPGDLTRTARGKQGEFKPAVQVDPRALAEVKESIAEFEGRITECFYGHLFQLLIMDDRNERPTATEVEATRHEVMMQAGPLLENLNPELLEPVVERTFAVLDRADMLPLPPPELEGQPVKIEFISIMHQMQQATGLVGLRTLMREVQLIAQTHPDVVDKIDADAAADELGRITGVRTEIVLSRDKVAQVRRVRAEREERQQADESMLAATQGLKNVAQVDPTKVSELASALSPAASGQLGGQGL